MITSDVFKKRYVKANDLKNQDGLNTTNCFYCQKSDLEKNMVKRELKTRRPGLLSGGDLLLICKGCFGK